MKMYLLLKNGDFELPTIQLFQGTVKVTPQVIQAVTFLPPIVGLVTNNQPLSSGHVFTHHPKRSQTRRTGTHIFY